MDEDKVISLFDAQGGEHKFQQVAGIKLGTQRYAVLAPLDEVPGLRKDQALVFSIADGGEDKATLSIVTDGDVIEAVFQEYHALMERKFEEKASSDPAML